MKKKEKQRKDLLKYQQNVEEDGHSDMYKVRNERLKQECIEKCSKIVTDLNKVLSKVDDLELSGEFIVKCKNDITLIVDDIQILSTISSYEEYLTAYDDMIEQNNIAMGVKKNKRIGIGSDDGSSVVSV